jgi:hypothetical protein
MRAGFGSGSGSAEVVAFDTNSRWGGVLLDELKVFDFVDLVAIDRSSLNSR